MTKNQVNDVQLFLTFQFTDELRIKVQDKIQMLMDNHQLSMFKTSIIFNMQGSLFNPIGLYDVKQQLNHFNKAKIQCIGQFLKLLFTVRKNYEVQTQGQQESTKHVEAFNGYVYELIQQLSQDIMQKQLTLPLEQLESACSHFNTQKKNIKDIKTPSLKDYTTLEGMIQQLPNHYARAQVLAEYMNQQGVTLQGNSNLIYELDFTSLSPNEFYALQNICKKYFPDGQANKTNQINEK